jgi:transposase-like protein
MASKKIPRSDLVINMIKEVLRKRGVVQSQEDLCYHTLDELKKYDKNYVLSPKRTKELVIKIPNIEIKAKTKRVPKIKKLEYCPICKKKFNKIYGRNLLNQKIHIGYICKRCGYTTDLESFMPMKYIFILKSRNKSM